MKYRWIEDTVQSMEFPYGDVIIFFKGKEFDTPDGGQRWVDRAISLGKVEEIINLEMEDADAT